MFYYLNGTLAVLEMPIAVLDCGGVGYQLTVSNVTAALLGDKIGKPTKLLTHLAVREDGVELFGFISREERECFMKLTSVSGIGPKAAMSILTLLTPERFALAVCTEDKKTIAKANGIGPKTAARVILELKDKLMKEHGETEMPETALPSSTGPNGRGKLTEATDALIVLGYSRAEALTALKDLDTANAELEDLIRMALKKLMKY